MAYNVQANLLAGSVDTDTTGLSSGITAAGNAFSGALQTYGQNKRADARRVEDRQWQQQDQIAQYARQDARDEKIFGRQDQLNAQQKAERDAEKAAKKQEEADAADGLLAGQIALYGKALTPEVLAAAQRMPSSAKQDFARSLASYGAEQFRAQAEEAERQRKRQEATQLTPLPQGDSYQMTGNGMLIPPKQTRPPELTPEQLREFGLRPDSVKVGGVTYKSPDPAPRTRLSPQRNADGSTTWVDPYTGQPVEGPPPASPSNLSTSWSPIPSK